MAKGITGRVGWYINRLKAMSPAEIAWRLQQKALQISEKAHFGMHTNIAEGLLYADIRGIVANSKNYADELSGIFNVAPLALSEDARPFEQKFNPAPTNWHLSPQTKAMWPLEWAYHLQYKQRDEIGDARLCWEKHRHYQWPQLALAYTIGGNKDALDKLTDEFYSWINENPMLTGIAWVSVMEVAIRSIQWMLTAAILRNSNGHQERQSDILCERLLTGAANMASYVARHLSRYSSANNHLLVELTAVGLAGLAFGHEKWTNIAIKQLTREISNQFSIEGVNLEVSLHYHTFAMEAYLLMHRAMRLSGKKEPAQWQESLKRWSRFARASMASETTAMEFGDEDSGKLLNLTGDKFEYYRYILQFASLETGEKYISFASIEPTIANLYPASATEAMAAREIVAPGRCEVFDARPRTGKQSDKRSGFAFLRSADNTVAVAVDAAPLGFGSIAAHAHADMLSFQLYANGNGVLVDGGTYLYHCNITDRDHRRSELMHNTVWRPAHPQGENRGPFLWGKRADAIIEKIEDANGTIRLSTSVGSTNDATFAAQRIFEFNTLSHQLTITDTNLEAADITTLIVAPGINVDISGDTATFGTWKLTLHSPAQDTQIKQEHNETGSGGHITAEPIDIAPHYGTLAQATALRITGRSGTATFTIAPTSKK